MCPSPRSRASSPAPAGAKSPLGFRVYGIGFRVLGFRVQGLGFRVQGSGLVSEKRKGGRGEWGGGGGWVRGGREVLGALVPSESEDSWNLQFDLRSPRKWRCIKGATLGYKGTGCSSCLVRPSDL